MSRRSAEPPPPSTDSTPASRAPLVDAAAADARATLGEGPEQNREGAPITRRATTASHLPVEAAMTSDVDNALTPLHPTREAVRPEVPATKPSACAHVVASTGTTCEGVPITRRAATVSHLPVEAAMASDVDTALTPLHPTREAVRPEVPATKSGACAHVVASTDAIEQRR